MVNGGFLDDVIFEMVEETDRRGAYVDNGEFCRQR